MDIYTFKEIITSHKKCSSCGATNKDRDLNVSIKDDIVDIYCTKCNKSMKINKYNK